MALKSSGILEAFLGGVQMHKQAAQQQFENERALEQEEQRKASIEQAKAQFDAQHKMQLDKLNFDKAQADFETSKAMAITDQSALKALEEGRAFPGASTMINLGLGADEEGSGPMMSQDVHLPSGLEMKGVPTPQALAQAEAERLRTVNAPAYEQQEKLKEIAGTANAERDAAKAESKRLEDERRAEREQNNLVLRGTQEAAIKATEAKLRKELQQEKIAADYKRTMDATYARNASAEKRAEIAATKEAVKAGNLKLAPTIQKDLTDLQDIQATLQGLIPKLEKRNWDYFQGISVEGIKNAAQSFKGEPIQEWNEITRDLNKIAATVSHKNFGQALTGTEKEMLLGFVTEASHLIETGKAKSDLAGLLAAAERAIDNLYANAGATPPKAKEAAKETPKAAAPAANLPPGARVYGPNGQRQ